MLGGIGLTEILVILLVVLLIFGAAKLPEIAKSLAKAIKEFKKGISCDKPDTEK